MSPNARTAEFYKKQGALAVIVEHWSPFPKPWGKRHDFLGIFDVIVLKPGGEIWGVQATTNSNMTSRITKIQAHPNTGLWLERGGRIAVVGWAKMGAKGHRKLWQMKELEIKFCLAAEDRSRQFEPPDPGPFEEVPADKDSGV